MPYFYSGKKWNVVLQSRLHILYFSSSHTFLKHFQSSVFLLFSNVIFSVHHCSLFYSYLFSKLKPQSKISPTILYQPSFVTSYLKVIFYLTFKARCTSQILLETSCDNFADKSSCRYTCKIFKFLLSNSNSCTHCFFNSTSYLCTKHSNPK